MPIDPIRYTDAQRVASVLFSMFLGPGGAHIDCIRRGPCPYCGYEVGLERTPGKGEELLHCKHCKKPVMYVHGANRFYAMKGH